MPLNTSDYKLSDNQLLEWAKICTLIRVRFDKIIRMHLDEEENTYKQMELYGL